MKELHHRRMERRGGVPKRRILRLNIPSVRELQQMLRLARKSRNYKNVYQREWEKQSIEFMDL
jgi:hypothetical protein